MQDFKQYIQNNLNEQQKLAATEKDGVFLVVAGAGSGKTRVITSRIANLIINENVSAYEIVALTFTNKAANEMRERIKEFLPYGSPVPYLGTFHSYCLQLLKKNRDKLDKPFESILDQDDQIKILNGIITRNGLNKRITAKKLAYGISQVKNNITSDKENMYEAFSSDRFLRDVFVAYEHEKTLSKCFDFDDLLIETVKLFGRNSQFKKEIQEHIRHILVDEYQDTNMTQHALLKHLTLNNNNNNINNPSKFDNKFNVDSLCVVGDEDQSIYSWRGATISNIINFKRDFPDAKLIKLEQNYRSVQPILSAANEVIKNNKKRNPKNLWSERTANNRIKTVQSYSEYQEGEIVSQFLKIASKKQKLSSIAILYRAHYQSRSIEEALVKACIPYKIIGGLQFYERKEIKDILAYLKLLINPFDRVSFFRVINCPTRGLGQKFEEQFYNLWSLNPFSEFKEIAQIFLNQQGSETCSLTGIKKTSLENFIKIFENIHSDNPTSKTIETLIIKSGYKQFLIDSCEKEEYESRMDNLNELVRAAEFMEKNGTKTISQFLEEVTLMQESLMAAKDDQAFQDENGQKTDPVLMMTLHAAKGLEFDTVIIIGIEEGILPSSRSLLEEEGLEEERRLFYVGLTRAKERLLLSHSQYRYAFGQTSYQPVSRFLKEIPEGLKIEVDFSRANYTQIDSTFCTWLGQNTAYQPGGLMTFGLSREVDSEGELSNFNIKAPETKKIHVNQYAPERKNSFNKYQHTPESKNNFNKYQHTPERKNSFNENQYKPESNRKFDENQFKFEVENQESSSLATSKNWRKNQPVSHSKFGIGVVQEIEIKSDNKIYVTARFKSGTKKLDSDFLTKV